MSGDETDPDPIRDNTPQGPQQAVLSLEQLQNMITTSIQGALPSIADKVVSTLQSQGKLFGGHR